MGTVLLLTLFCLLSLGNSTHVDPSGDDWPMFRHDPAYTGFSSSSVNATPTVLWNSSSSGAPVIADGYLATGGGTVTCRNASNGEQLWRQRVHNPAGNVAIYNGYVYTSSGAFNVSTGEMKLNYTNNFGFATPNIVEDVIYFGSYLRGGVFALNATTGAYLWNFTSGLVYSSPAVSQGLVYFNSVEGILYALNASTGEQLWTYRGLSGYESSSPSISDGYVYIGTTYGSNGKVICLDAMSGTEIWTASIPAGMSSPAVAYGCVYIVSNSTVYALNASTGDLLWNATGGGGQSPAVAGGTVYVSCSYNVYALNASTGAKIWNYTFPKQANSISTYPAIANGTIYVDTGYSLYAFGSPPSSPTSTPSPSPTIPELSQFSGIVLAAVVFMTMLFSVWKKQLRTVNNSNCNEESSIQKCC